MTTIAPLVSRRIFSRPTTSKPPACLYFKATFLAALGHLLETSRLSPPCPGGPPPSECLSPLHPLTSLGPSGCSLTAPSAGRKAKARAQCPRRPSRLGVLEHQAPPGQLSLEAFTYLSGRRQARRPTVARRPAARTRLPAPEVRSVQGPPCTPHRRPSHPAGTHPLRQPGLQHPSLSLPVLGSVLHPTPLFSPLGTGNSCRQLFNPL